MRPGQSRESLTDVASMALTAARRSPVIRFSVLLAVVAPILIVGGTVFFVPMAARAEQPYCGITAVKVTGTPAVHRYSFQMTCDNGTFLASAVGAYDVGSGQAQEKIVGISGAWTYASLWTCPTDPWIAIDLFFFHCSKSKISETGSPPFTQGKNEQFPMSALETDQDRHVLAAQLTNALNAASAPTNGAAHGNIKLLPGPLAKGADHSDVLKLASVEDLTVVRVDGPTTLAAGESGTYTFIIGNVGTLGGPVEVNLLFTGALDETGQVSADSGLSCDSVPSSGKVACRRRRRSFRP